MTVLAPEVEAPIETLPTKIKLSEAMRIGSMVTEKMKESYADDYNNVTQACAIGAAWVGAGKPGTVIKFSHRFFLGDGGEQWGPIFKYPCDHSKRRGELFNVVTHLNDECDWTRERIADWLEEQGL